MGLPVLTADNQCGACKVCCEHWAISRAHGADFDKVANRLCSFWNNGCSRQDNKPMTCQCYDCAYISCLPELRRQFARPDQSHMLPYWVGSELNIRVLADRFGLDYKTAQLLENDELLDRVRQPLNEMLDWAFMAAASRCGQLSVHIHSRRVLLFSSADVLATCYRRDRRDLVLDRKHVDTLRTFPCPDDRKDPYLIQPGEEWQRISADLKVRFVAYRVAYGWRLRAGYVDSPMVFDLDWCLGDNGHETREFQYAFKAMLKMVDENWRNRRPHFHGIPPHSMIKPIFRDPAFVIKVFRGVGLDDTIVDVGPNESDDQVECVYKSRRSSCRCSWCGKKRGALKQYARDQGSHWRSRLNMEWAFGASNHSELRQIRNKIGPSVMHRIPKHLVEER